MTDKQIIIDGVDVCRCRYYDDRYGYCDARKDDIDGNSYTKCMYEDNCYYKQLKAKEQECERLKKAIKLYNCIEKWGTKECHCACRCLGNEFCNDAEKKINQLKAENEILEKVNKNNQEKIKKLNETLEEEFIAKQYGDEALFFTLMDIKEIAKPYNDMSGNCVIVNCFEDMNKILNIISEVIKDEE